MIYTFTLAPAYDSFAFSAELKPGHENLISDKETFAGGKGINVSRAIAAYGGESTALVLLGANNSADFEEALAGFDFKSHIVKVPGAIRENLTISHNGIETRICTEGFAVSEQALYELESKAVFTAEDTVIVSGRMPAGLSHKACLDFLGRIRKSGARLVVDSKSFSLRELGDLGVWMVKPNREEIAAALGGGALEIKDMHDCRAEVENYGIEYVLTSFDKDGAVLIHRDNYFETEAPSIRLVSSVGAGDSMLAGFVLGMQESADAEYGLKLAAAFGSAACLSRGVLGPSREDIDRLLRVISK